MDCSPPGSSVHEVLQARILEWVAISFSREIFLTQGLRPHLLCLLHWQEDPLPLSHLGSPCGVEGGCANPSPTSILMHFHTSSLRAVKWMTHLHAGGREAAGPQDGDCEENLPPAGKGAKMVVTWRGRCVGRVPWQSWGLGLKGPCRAWSQGLRTQTSLFPPPGLLQGLPLSDPARSQRAQSLSRGEGVMRDLGGLNGLIQPGGY